MTKLILGGMGKTSRRIAQLLHQANVPFILASRSNSAPAPFRACKFDWLDESTYNIPFENASNIDAIYMVPPGTLDVFSPMKAFIDFAKTKGVNRFVLLSASPIEAGGPAFGKVHEYLIDLKVDYVVLRPTWFMQNMSEIPANMTSIRDDGKIYSAADDGKIPWISCDDIAAVAFHALVDEPAANTDYLILGPELLSYNEIAQTLSDVLHRKVEHVKLSESELVNLLQQVGLPDDYASMLASYDTAISHGSEARLNNVVEEVTGKKPTTFRAFAEANREVWN